MKSLYYVVLSMLAIMGLACQSACAHPVNIHITAQTAAGVALSEVPLKVSTGRQIGYGLTDSNGVLVLTLQADENFRAVVTRLTPQLHQPGLEQFANAARLKYAQYKKAFFFHTLYVQAASPTATDVNVLVTAHPVIAVSMRLHVEPSPSPEKLLASVSGGVFWTAFAVDEEVVINGVRKDAAGAISILLPRSHQIRSLPLSVAQTHSDVSLGELVIQEVASDAHLELVFTNREGIADENLVLQGDEMFLVRSDAQVVLSYSSSTDGRIVARYAGGQPVHTADIPAGTYYVIPGAPGGPTQRKLVSMITAGQLAALDTANVPKVQIATGQTLQVSINAREAYDAIVAAVP